MQTRTIVRCVELMWWMEIISMSAQVHTYCGWLVVTSQTSTFSYTGFCHFQGTHQTTNLGSDQHQDQ